MKKLFVFVAAVTFSTSVLAGNISENKNMKATQNQMMDTKPVENILQNEDMQRLHRDMTLYAISELGMEARVKMMTKEGRAYHKALEQREKNTAG
ncbi:MAG: hypothetical protein LPK13_07285 [Marinobacter sp.]|uniref:hypothetical protein n=1 Tax=Marinobacter sp. TaxID=50741 RepID=UPI0029C1D186|nr:hypothetical protein [Marinobacter sp.]MDX5335872.1 hypothetical protein [Marinobacter sp.]MDX5386898.1 hypothetical protein [Marinobacter sp.]MDX5439147.1 hypothetical protein [Alteromonadaceae bacterium]MDX5472282.1 hypothetical protein [Marinobacter sp.]